MSMTQVDLVCDAGPSVGYGHLRRTLTLAEALRHAGVVARVTGLSEQAKVLLPPQQPVNTDPDVVVFDAPQGLNAEIQKARADGRCVVALDWFGDSEPDVAIVIYPHRTVRARLQSYVGIEYQMIRSEITSQPVGNEGKGVVVMLGGGDLRGQGHLAALKLVEQGLKVTLIQGPLVSSPPKIVPYEVLINPPDLPERLVNCSWLVTNGGGCMFEAMYLGKPVVSLPQTEQEMVLARYVYERDALLGIGVSNLRRYTHGELRPVAQRAAAMVDGYGAERVANIIRKLI
jgi:spore coat polysaccharide biosynthesis predicted glycosyltransferase SpsG